MSKHTPGPWTLHGRFVQRRWSCSAVVAKTLIAKVYAEAYNDIAEETANANLIAAAPELLEALKLSRLGFEAMIEDGRCGETFVAVSLTLDKINVAIAKAEGKQ